MPRRLPDEVLEDVLRRLPPHEPADLVRAALVSRRWCRLVSDAGFRRRFREFHRRPPILGMLCNRYSYDPDFPSSEAWFVPTTAFCTPRKRFRDMSVLDVRHGRVLLRWDGVSLVVWDPIADKMQKLPFPPKKKRVTCSAAVLCSAAGACDHLDCHEGPFLVVFLCSYENGNAEVCTYSSDAAAWSEPVCAPQKYCIDDFWMRTALVGNSLYFKNGMGSAAFNGMGGTALKYDLDLRQVSFVLLPPVRRIYLRESLLTAMDDGGLGLIYIDDSKLYMWSRKDTPEVDAKWESRVIELKTVFPDDVAVTKLTGVIGSGVGIIFMRTEYEVYTIDLKTNEVKKVCEGSGDKLFPYTSFYTPALEEVRNQVQVAQVHDKPKVLRSELLGKRKAG